jgi:alkylhydroperoxidase family enzyme
VLGEELIDELARYEQSDRFSAREKIALRYTDAIMWNPHEADDAMWAELHRHFTEPELVELGYFIGFTSGGQRWIQTLQVKHGEVLADTQTGLKQNAST